MVDILKDFTIQRRGVRPDLPQAVREALGCPEAQTNPKVQAMLGLSHKLSEHMTMADEAKYVRGLSKAVNAARRREVCFKSERTA